MLLALVLLAAPLGAAEPPPPEPPLEMQSDAELLKKKQAIEMYFQYQAIAAELQKRQTAAEKAAEKKEKK